MSSPVKIKQVCNCSDGLGSSPGVFYLCMFTRTTKWVGCALVTHEQDKEVMLSGTAHSLTIVGAEDTLHPTEQALTQCGTCSHGICNVCLSHC